MDLSLSIEELLFDHDRITLPGFGSFLATYSSAHKDDSGKKLMPPKRVILFRSDMKTSEGVLKKYLRSQFKLGEEEADKEIAAFIEKIEQELEDQVFAYIFIRFLWFKSDHAF